MRITKRTDKKLLIAVIGVLTAGVLTSAAQERDADRVKTSDQVFSDQKLKPIMDRIESRSDDFEDRFEAALDKSSIDGSNLEDRLNQWADLLEDELDNMAENYKERDYEKSVEHLENALIVAEGINRAMLHSDLSSQAEEQWNLLREDMNTIAMAFHRPVLANVTVATLVPATDALMTKAEVTQVMERIEAATDRFKEKFEKAMDARVATKTNREDFFTRWAQDLEDVSDDMLEEYNEKDEKEFSEELQNTLVIAAALNRMVLRSDLTEDVNTEWESLRKDLNTLATVFGHAVLPDTIVSVRG